MLSRGNGGDKRLGSSKDCKFGEFGGGGGDDGSDIFDDTLLTSLSFLLRMHCGSRML